VVADEPAKLADACVWSHVVYCGGLGLGQPA
jgi:hypothetical protein